MDRDDTADSLFRDLGGRGVVARGQSEGVASTTLARLPVSGRNVPAVGNGNYWHMTPAHG